MKKEFIVMALFIIIFSALVVYGMNRFENINNGTMQVVNQNQMDR